MNFNGDINNGYNDVFSGDITFSGKVWVPDGTATAPSVAFTSDQKTGFFKGATHTFSISANGTKVCDFASTASHIYSQLFCPGLTATGPISAGTYGISGGSMVGSQFSGGPVLCQTYLGEFQATRTADGTAANPAYTFISDTATGFYSSGLNEITFVSAGTPSLVLDGGFTTVPQPLYVQGTCSISGATTTGALSASSISTAGTAALGATTITGTASVSGATTTGALSASSISTSGTAALGATTITGTASVSGATTTGALSASSISTAGTAALGATTITGTASVSTSVSVPQIINGTGTAINISTTGSLGFPNLTLNQRSNRTNSQTISTGSFTVVTWDFSEHSTGDVSFSTTGSFTLGTTGTYRLSYSFGFASNSTGIRKAMIWSGTLSTSFAYQSQNAVNGDATWINGSEDIVANSGTTFNLQVYQNSGGNLSADISSSLPFFSIVRVR